MAAHSRRLEAKNDASTVSIGAASAALVAENRERLDVWITNNHATQILWLSLGGTAVVGEGIKVAAGETRQISSFMGAINAIATGAATPVALAEV